ncbi:adenylyl-sulfate kinase [Streptomyces hoynatensis]|uniref:adenylyl-sulfate kinase n=1 Tax=Streptomyces hoynatensis TaxID=1141874 RepID=UPI00131A1F3C|nr:adenylyl-sulfate kinase [Streptomyces hoynatensis]
MRSGHLPLLWLYGPSGVGKSTVGWEIFRQLHEAGTRAAYVDADQLGLAWDPPADDPGHHRLKAANLGAVWAGFRAAGARCLVFSGFVEDRDTARHYAAQVPDAALTLCRLRAGAAELRSRIVGRGWQTHLADEVVRDAPLLERDDFSDVHVDTDALPVPEVARRVRRAAGNWPALAPREGSAR